MPKKISVIISDGEIFELGEFEVNTFYALMILPDGFLSYILYKLCTNRNAAFQVIMYKDELVRAIIMQLRKCHDTLHGETLPANFGKIDNV